MWLSRVLVGLVFVVLKGYDTDGSSNRIIATRRLTTSWQRLLDDRETDVLTPEAESLGMDEEVVLTDSFDENRASARAFLAETTDLTTSAPTGEDAADGGQVTMAPTSGTNHAGGKATAAPTGGHSGNATKATTKAPATAPTQASREVPTQAPTKPPSKPSTLAPTTTAIDETNSPETAVPGGNVDAGTMEPSSGVDNSGTVSAAPSPRPTGHRAKTQAPTVGEGDDDSVETPEPTLEPTKVQFEQPVLPPHGRPTAVPVYVPPTQKPAQYVSTDDDPLQDSPGDDASVAEWEWNTSTVDEMEHNQTVVIALSIVFGVMFLFSIFVAQQMIENPHGCCASTCRVAVTCMCGILRCVCYPCRAMCGCTGHSKRNHMIVPNDVNYTHDLELT